MTRHSPTAKIKAAAGADYTGKGRKAIMQLEATLLVNDTWRFVNYGNKEVFEFGKGTDYEQAFGMLQNYYAEQGEQLTEEMIEM